MPCGFNQRTDITWKHRFRVKIWQDFGVVGTAATDSAGSIGVLERVKVECGHVAEVGHVLCQNLRCARDFEKHKNILMKL